MATITVRGQGIVTAPPDEVSVGLEVAATNAAPADAFAQASERSAGLERLCDELGIPQQARSTTGISLQELQEQDPDGRLHRRYRASNRLTLRLREPELVPPLLRDAVERVQAQVSGPWWRLAPDNPAHLEACRLAAADARRRAEAYAEALGRRLGPVERVAEAGTRPEPVPRATAAFAAAGPPLQVGELEATATIEATYTLVAT
jgi:hypothetical protein